MLRWRGAPCSGRCNRAARFVLGFLLVGPLRDLLRQLAHARCGVSRVQAVAEAVAAAFKRATEERQQVGRVCAADESCILAR